MPDQDQRDPLDEVRVAAHGLERLAGDRHRIGVGQEAEVLADDLLDRPAEERGARVGHEREDAVAVGTPDDVGRRLDQPAEARLLVGHPREQVRVGQRDRGLVGETLEQVEVVGLERPWLGGRDRERPDDVAPGRSQRRRGHADETHPAGHVLVVGLVRDPRIGHVVRRPDGHAVLGRKAVDAATEREPHAHEPAADLGVGAAGDHDRDQVAAGRGHPGQVCTIGLEEALRILDDALEDLVRVAQGGDAGRDVAQRALGLGPAGEGLARALELVDEPGVGDGDRGLLGEAAQHRGIELVEGIGIVADDLDRAERSGLADDRRGDQVAHRRELGQRVGQVVVLELGGAVVADMDDPSLGHGLAGHALPEPEAVHLERLALLDGQAGVVRPDQALALRVVLVDHRAVGPEQPARLVDDVLEDLVRLAQRGDARGDLRAGCAPHRPVARRRSAIAPAPPSGWRSRSRSRRGSRAPTASRRRRRCRSRAHARRPRARRAAARPRPSTGRR